MSHTPGPWRVNGETVCEMETDDVIAQPGENFSIINPSQTLGANARLIAAAPELLATLEAMLADADTMNEPYRNEALCETARAAIAKAT